MFELYLPYLIATAFGMSFEDSQTAVIVPQAEEIAPEVEVAETATSNWVAEPQVADGRYTSAIEVKPILGMTERNWVAIDNDGTNDLVYFTHLMAWRCGLFEIRYGFNGDPADTVLPMEPCYMDTGQPNGLVDIINYPIYLVMPSESVQSVRIEVVFDDATESGVELLRNQIVMP